MHHIIGLSGYRRIALTICCLLLSGSALIVPQGRAQQTIFPEPVTALEVEGIRIERYFSVLNQGRAGLIRLTGSGITEARALFIGQEIPFLPLLGSWYALLVAPVDAGSREYPLSLLTLRSDGTPVTIEDRVLVENAGFIRQNFSVPANLGYLIEPEVERAEYARLFALMTASSTDPLWDETGFQTPMQTDFVSAFGQLRILNGSVQTRHTGWDQRAPVGTPIAAMANGRVVYADALDIRGNYILIDHGWGVFTGYAHLSQINVAPGQSVEIGQVIGLSGNTGRSSGPHLHWEVAVGGEWVDGVDFIGIWLPGERIEASPQ